MKNRKYKITSEEIRKRFFDFMIEKKHKIVPSSSMMPQDDPTTLFTGSGMQPMIKYLLGEEHPEGTRIADIQKCFRAVDMEDVGDNRHTTSFEMVGNWSFGDYFKKEEIEWIFEFLMDEKKGIGLDPKRFFVTVFNGDKKNNLPKDTEAAEIWKKLFFKKGIDAKILEMGSAEDASKKGMEVDGQNARIFFYDSKENWWSRAGIPDNMPINEPGGPDSEMFYDYGGLEDENGDIIKHDKKFGEFCHPACDCGRFVEIGNNVFMTYKKVSDKVFEELPKKNIDHGSGLERWLAAANNQNDIFKTDIFEEAILIIEEISQKKYDDIKYKKDFRIISDHIKSAVFMISDDLIPSNKDAGYILRKLIRKSVSSMQRIDFDVKMIFKVAEKFIKKYDSIYYFSEKKDLIKKVLEEEAFKFEKTLKGAEKIFNKILEKSSNKIISSKDIFNLVTTYGLPIDIIEDKLSYTEYSFSKEDFDKEIQLHKNKSKTATEGKFKGGLGGQSPIEIAYHTATHLMLAGLQKFAGDNIHQKGSNITSERMRFDFSSDKKIEKDILEKVEKYVNDVILNKAEVVVEEMDKNKAKESGVEGSFWEKYPDIVKVWTIKDENGNVLSKELCGGPHVKNTFDISEFGKFKIKKESSSSAGVRRIKAIFEKD